MAAACEDTAAGCALTWLIVSGCVCRAVCELMVADGGTVQVALSSLVGWFVLPPTTRFGQ